jgi:hypothetical protein
LPNTEITQLLTDGISEPVNNLYPEHKQPIEEVSISELNRCLPKHKPNKLTSPSLPLPTSTSLIKTHAQALSQLISQCQQNFADQEQLAENLQVMAEYSRTILEAINSVTSNINNLQPKVRVATPAHK